MFELSRPTPRLRFQGDPNELAELRPLALHELDVMTSAWTAKQPRRLLPAQPLPRPLSWVCESQA